MHFRLELQTRCNKTIRSWLFIGGWTVGWFGLEGTRIKVFRQETVDAMKKNLPQVRFIGFLAIFIYFSNPNLSSQNGVLQQFVNHNKRTKVNWVKRLHVERTWLHGLLWIWWVILTESDTIMFFMFSIPVIFIRFVRKPTMTYSTFYNPVDTNPQKLGKFWSYSDSLQCLNVITIS